MNNILMCLDYNDTIDNLISRCADYESEGRNRLPMFFKGVLSMAVSTKSNVSVAIISSAGVDDIKDEINVINYYASQYCKLATPPGESLIRYIVGNKNQDVYNCETNTTTHLSDEALTKKEGVEAILDIVGRDNVDLVITGGDTHEDIAMMQADTGSIPNVFVAPKANKEVDLFDSTVAIRDGKNSNSEGVGRCLVNISRNLGAFNLQEVFSEQKPQQDDTQCYAEDYFAMPAFELASRQESEAQEIPQLVSIASESSVNANHEFIKIADQKVTVPTSHYEPEQTQTDVLAEYMLEFPL